MTRLLRLFAAAAAVSVCLPLPAQCPYPYPNQPQPQPQPQVVGGQGGAGAGTSTGSSPASPRPSQGTPSTPSPSYPTTPGHSPRPGVTGGPATTPGTTQPTTPRSLPTGAAAAGRSGARGAVMAFERGATSRDRLRLDWQHPVPPERGTETSASPALPLAEALAQLWGDDQRPLLVMRECRNCAGTDMPLLHSNVNNEQTQLLANWFRIVRLPPHVTQPQHPFYHVFQGYDFGDEVPHFFLLAHPDAQPVAFTGNQAPADLWKGMTAVLRERYLSDPQQAVKRWQRLLGQFDVVEAQRKRLTEELGEARAESGPKSSRARRLAQQLDEANTEMEQLEAREQRVRNLVLQPFPKSTVAK